ncbi:MAG: serine hydrolase [Ruminococcus sp.]|nr:serine hydrolase [Ruminococcus sp.]
MSKRSGGGVAVIAVLVGIIIIAIGTAVLFLTGKSRIIENKNVPAIAESVADSSSLSESDLDSSVVDSQVDSMSEALLTYPEDVADYKDIKDKDFTADYAVLIDSQDNTVVAGKNYEKKIYPASLTKIMTLVVAAENLEDIDETYKFSADDIDPLVEMDASRAGFDAGETVTIEDLMYSSILVSGADGTTGLANAVAGSEKNFVDMMNEKAEELGLKNTHFENANGLHSKNHYSTCEDMALLLKYAMENELCNKVLTANTYTTSKTSQHKDGIELTSILAMRLDGYYVEGGGDIVGGKTGFTDEAKYTLATKLEYGDKEYICVTARSDKEFAAIEDTILVYEKYVPREAETAEESSSEAA